jgi:hypothetical protein
MWNNRSRPRKLDRDRRARIEKFRKFFEIVFIAGTIQLVLNALLYAFNIEARLGFYEVALIWIFCG